MIGLGGGLAQEPAEHEKPDYVAEQIDQERRVVVRRVSALLREGRPGYAHFVLVRSVERQARIAGLGTLPIEPTAFQVGPRVAGVAS